MKGILGKKSLRIFIKVLKFIAKYSQEYILEAKDKKLFIKCCSSTQVSMVKAIFDELFFVKYEESSKPEENVCTVSARVLLNVVKNYKTIASCSIRMDVPNDSLHVNIHKNNDIIVRNDISLLEPEQLDDYIIPNDYSEIVCQPSVFRRVLQSSRGIDELEFNFKQNHVVIKSFIDYPNEDCETVRLNYKIDASQFISYKVNREEVLVASCPDFIILLNLAQSLESEICMQFTVSGRPIISKLKCDGTYALALIQATLPPKLFHNRNIKQVTYNQMVKKYSEKRKKEACRNKELAEKGMKRIGNLIIECPRPKTIANTSNIELSMNRSSPPTYISTPSSSARTNSKRKSTNENLIMEQDDLDATMDNLYEKRRKTELNDVNIELNSTVVGSNSTVVGTNCSIILTQKELNEVENIMAEIGNLDEDDYDMMSVDPQPEAQYTESHDVEMTNVQGLNKNSEELFSSDDRLPLNNSYFRDSENEQKENVSNNIKSNKFSRGPLDPLFGHIFRPRSRADFGKVIVPGSDSESEDIL